MSYKALWEAQGEVTGTRVLKAKDEKSDWKGWLVSVAVIGATLEVMVEEEDFGNFAKGDAVAMQGRMEPRKGGGYNLVLEQYRKPPKSVA